MHSLRDPHGPGTTIQEDDAFVSLRGHLPGLVAGLGELKTAVANRDDLSLKKELALRDLRLALERAKRAYNLMVPRLQLLFPGDAALVETFFRQLHGAAAKPQDEEPTEPGASGAPGVPGNPEPHP